MQKKLSISTERLAEEAMFDDSAEHLFQVTKKEKPIKQHKIISINEGWAIKNKA